MHLCFEESKLQLIITLKGNVRCCWKQRFFSVEMGFFSEFSPDPSCSMNALTLTDMLSWNLVNTSIVCGWNYIVTYR